MKDPSDTALDLEREPVPLTNIGHPGTRMEPIQNIDHPGSEQFASQNIGNPGSRLAAGRGHIMPKLLKNPAFLDGEIWCSLKEFKKINTWAKERSTRYLQTLLHAERFPFPSRKSYSPHNNRLTYEIQVTDPTDKILLMVLRNDRSQNKDQKESPTKANQQRHRRMRFVLPAFLATMVKSDTHRVLIEAGLKKFFSQYTEDMKYQEVDISLPKDIAENIHNFAKKNGITLGSAFQIMFMQVFSKGELFNPNQKGEK
jgi:hypothetical protein